MKRLLLVFVAFACGGTSDEAATVEGGQATAVALPVVDTVAAYDTTQLGPGPHCVYNRGDDRLIGTLLSLDSITATVRISPELAREGGLADTTTREITVPRNGTIRACI